MIAVGVSCAGLGTNLMGDVGETPDSRAEPIEMRYG